MPAISINIDVNATLTSRPVIRTSAWNVNWSCSLRVKSSPCWFAEMIAELTPLGKTDRTRKGFEASVYDTNEGIQPAESLPRAHRLEMIDVVSVLSGCRTCHQLALRVTRGAKYGHVTSHE